MNAKQRYNARRSAEYHERKAYIKKIDRAFARLSGEASERVEKAASLGSLRDKETNGSCCLPEVALYRAGNRSIRKGATHITR